MSIKTTRKYREELKEANLRLKKAYKEVRDSHIQIVFRLAVMAEYRDMTTGSHLVRIADYSAMIAQGMGLSKTEVQNVRYASPMHDIGKIILPDSILKNKGKLTDDEREVMKRHPIAGAEIFRDSRSPIMQACGVIALTHHERYDGSGYPYGLKGKEIPLYGRIVGVADVFDALTSKRPYKKAYSFERSVSMVTAMAGRNFDPDVVKAFVRSEERIRGVWEANRDIEDFLDGVGGLGEAVPRLDLKIQLMLGRAGRYNPRKMSGGKLR
ncbi:MAG: HD domain-containing protein [Candidatus Omnitrophica bacterium]|nr:HD domain-containing protein [Candidatus Omnitrophota bacterium]